MASSPLKSDKKFNFSVIPFYPVLLAIYSVLFLYSANLGQVPFSVLLRPLAFSVSVTFLITFLSITATKNDQKAGLFTGWLFFLFFTYGHGFDLINGKTILGMQIGYVKPLIAFGGLAAAGIVLISKIKFDLSRITKFLNIILGILVLISAIQISYYHIVALQEKRDVEPAISAERIGTAPDIYYIVLDSYARNDVLINDYNYDNSAFTNELMKRGFYLPDCAYSNYFGTSISIASSLNMQYLDELGFSTGVYSKDDPPELKQIIHHSEVRRFLKERNYSFIAFRGFFPTNDIKDADYYYEVFEDNEQSVTIASLSFENLYLKTTMFRYLEELFQRDKENWLWKALPDNWKILFDPDVLQYSSRSYKWYRQHVYTFDKLKEIPQLPGRKFIYAQIYATHQPYVFDSKGDFIWPVNEDNFNYLPAIEYVNKRTLEVIDTILTDSQTPPIIIIQADHGMPSGVTRNKILHAIYLPEHQELLYPTVTPVNTFRLIFNAIFQTSYELLPDKIYVLDETTKTVQSKPVQCNSINK